MIDSQRTDPLLSIVIPVYNGQALLPDCLHSVGGAIARLPQADRHLIELIICDNHSADSTQTIAERFDPGCPYRIVMPPAHLPNRTDNWNFGLRAGTGEWLMMLHHDDMLSDGSLRGILETIRSPRSAGAVVIAGRHRVIELGGRITPRHPKFMSSTRYRGNVIQRELMPFHCTLIPFTPVRREVFESVRGMNNRWELIQDWDFWLRVAGEGDVVYTPTEFGWWRAHEFTDRYALRFAQEHLAFTELLVSDEMVRLSDKVGKLVVPFQVGRVKFWGQNAAVEELNALCTDRTLVGSWLSTDFGEWSVTSRRVYRHMRIQANRERFRGILAENLLSVERK